MQPVKRSPQNLLPILLCILTMLLAACGGGNSNSTSSSTTAKAPANRQILVLPISGYPDVKTFDPALATDLASISAVDMVFTGLVVLDDHLQVHNDLAASYSLAPDGVTWTFKLKPNLKFSDGQPLTSANVAYSLDRALDPNLKSGVSPLYLGLIKDSDKRYSGAIKSLIGDSILTPDPQTVVLIANKKAAYFLQTLTYPTAYVVEKSLIDKYGNNFADHLSEGLGGEGPFKVSRYIHGREIDFVPNPYFFGPKPQLQKVVMPFYQEDDTTYKAYEANQADQAPVPATELAAAKALPGGQLHQAPLLDVYFYAMNYLAKPFDNIKIRQAFALSINKDEIAHDIYKDTVIATNHIIPTGMPGYNPNLTGPLGTKGTSGNTALAKQLFQQGLQEEGLTLATLPPITLTVSSQGAADARNEFATVQQMWKNTLGVNVRINDVDLGQLLDERTSTVNNPNGMQMWALYWDADYPDPQDWMTLIFDRGSAKNAFNYGQNNSSANAEQQANQKLMEAADINQNPTQRMQQYNQAEQQLVNDVVWIPRFQYANTLVRKPCVVGMVDNAENLIPPDDWGSIYISTDSSCANISQYQ
jgi:oligopeptide transport system substrate-binding protein